MAITPNDAAEAAARLAAAQAEAQKHQAALLATVFEPHIDATLVKDGRAVVRSLADSVGADAILLPAPPEVFEELARRYAAAGWSSHYDGKTLTIERLLK